MGFGRAAWQRMLPTAIKQSQLSAPYPPGLATVQKFSIIDGQRSTQGRLVRKSRCFMSEAYEIFNRVASEGK